MELTERQIEHICDGLRRAGFDLSETDDDKIVLIAQIIIDATDPKNLENARSPQNELHTGRPTRRC